MKNKDSNIGIIITSIILIIFIAIVTIYFLSNNSYFDNTPTKNNEIESSNDNNFIEENIDNSKNTQLNVKENTVEEKEIATYTTEIYDNDKNRVYNIKRACKVLDETIVKSNEEFSFNKKMGNMSKSDGYKKAKGFDSNGKDIKVYGGGICQLSSTLYNSVLIAKLNVTERHAHSKRVHYVPKNKDATIFAGGADLKFINNTKNDIKIYSSSDGNKVKVTLKEIIST